jgi:hypothetical protein
LRNRRFFSFFLLYILLKEKNDGKIKLALKKNPCPYPDTRNTSMDLKALNI